MKHTMKKFSRGGAQGMYDRRMADIEKDRKIALAKGKNADVVEAKAAQRKADAEDDRAKRTGADRTATRKAEYDAEQRLSRTRKFGADKPAAAAQPAATPAAQPAATPAAQPAATPEAAKAKPKTFGEAFKAERARLGAGKTFTYNGKSYTTNIAGEGRRATPPAAAKNNPPAAAAKTPPTTAEYIKTAPKSKTTTTPFSTAAKTPPAAAAKTPPAAAAKTKQAAAARVYGPSTKGPLNPNSIAGMIASGKLFGTSDAFKKSQEAKYGKAKGGKIMKKFAKGGSIPPQPSAADRARSKAQMDSLKKVKPTPAEIRALQSANRSEGRRYAVGGVTKQMPTSKQMGDLNMAKGGKAKMKPAAKGKAKGNPFAATKFGAAMMKKSADTKGRAMKKFAKGGSIDGCAQRGKTKLKRVTMKKGGSC